MASAEANWRKSGSSMAGVGGGADGASASAGGWLSALSGGGAALAMAWSQSGMPSGRGCKGSSDSSSSRSPACTSPNSESARASQWLVRLSSVSSANPRSQSGTSLAGVSSLLAEPPGNWASTAAMASTSKAGGSSDAAGASVLKLASRSGPLVCIQADNSSLAVAGATPLSQSASSSLGVASALGVALVGGNASVSNLPRPLVAVSSQS